MAKKEAEIGYDSIEVQEEAPCMYIRLTDQRPSGFILDGTRGTKDEQELTAPLARFIPNFGYRRGYKIEQKNGKPIRIPFNEPIRYIKEQTEISVLKQKELGIERNRATKEDLIEIKRGDFSVVREGSFIGLFDYIRDVFYNKNAEGRSARADVIYEIVDPGKNDEQLNDYDIEMADALQFVARFYQKTPKGYVYKEDKINSLCDLFQIFAETMPGKVTGLNALAKGDPGTFLLKAQKFEQINITLVAHALQLNVIRFNGNVAEYVSKEKIMANLGSEPLRHDMKIEKLAELLQSDDFKAINMEFLVELEAAKEKALNA